jgi:tetratricopeptide repeat protein
MIEILHRPAARGRERIDGDDGASELRSLQMPLTLPAWVLLASAIAVSALLIFPLLSDETRLALHSRLRSSSRMFGQDLRGASATLIVAAAAFLFVAGVGVVTSYVGGSPGATDSRHTRSFSEMHSGSNGEMLGSLKDYTRSIGAEQPASAAAGGKLLPDVNTMIEQLAARLETTPGDIKGWRMLAWSYFHTGRYKQAATAYARAVELDPNSAELKAAYKEAKAKAAENDNLETASSPQTRAAGKGGDGPIIERDAKSRAPPEYAAAIRSMVDGLAGRLENSPRDVEGWTRLMRARVVLGEREVAATAMRKALDIFKDDAAASSRITAVAIELDLTGK